jgi:gamma-glutamyltranspeptidase/glutathione hydrolase
MSISWEFPYPSQRMPVLARNVVATSQPLAAQAGLRMLLKGGNAVDAALGAAIALTVLEPTSNGIGSDAFALVWNGDTLHGLNGSGRSPRAWSRERFGGLNEMPSMGWDSVTIPGAVDAWVTLSRRFGALPFADLFGPAVEYARHGFMVAPITAARWAEAAELYRQYPVFGQTFLPKGRAPRSGEEFRCPQQARTLERIAETTGESFYRGDLAEKILQHSRSSGGTLTAEDLGAHQSEWVKPLAVEYRGQHLHELPPNGQGLTALIALGILREFNLQRYPLDSADSIHLQIEAIKIAFAHAYRNIADRGSMAIAPEELLDINFLTQRARSIRLDRSLRPESKLRWDRGTIYLAAADEGGRMVSMIQSNYMGFGSGIVIPETGISLQNRGCGFVLEKGHPNCVGGGKRPFHTIIPAFVTRNGRPLMSFGVMGGSMQPQGHVQVMVRMADYGQNPQAACDAPRWFVDNDFQIALEPGFSPQVVGELKRHGHRLLENTPTSIFGGAQVIYCMDDGYCAASDPRKDGQAVGY